DMLMVLHMEDVVVIKLVKTRTEYSKPAIEDQAETRKVGLNEPWWRNDNSEDAHRHVNGFTHARRCRDQAGKNSHRVQQTRDRRSGRNTKSRLKRTVVA